jgi:hypothetical protein
MKPLVTTIGSAFVIVGVNKTTNSKVQNAENILDITPPGDVINGVLLLICSEAEPGRLNLRSKSR